MKLMQTVKSSGDQVLRPRARILRTFGDELISSEAVAVIELVKNAYDADATRVLVRFNKPLEVPKEKAISTGSIEVIDNGHGMSLEVIKTAWMEPATLIKRQQTRSEFKNRRVLGEKGIGRFASSRLADNLEVVTRRIDENYETRALFNWNAFDDPEKYLDEVTALWEQSEPVVEIAPGGVVEALWKFDNSKPNAAEELTHGTILRMEGLRVPWKETQLEKLRTDLSRLISPFFYEDELSEKDEFKIFLELPEPFEHLSGLITPPRAISEPRYLLSGEVDKEGVCDFKVILPGHCVPRLVGKQFFLKDGHKPQCGPFQIKLRVWDRDAESLGVLAEKYGSTITDVRRDLDNAAGISIYRDGFRVLPYGEPKNDWLRLDMRRVQNPTLRLSNNQIVGYILISSDENGSLRDQSNREGLVEGTALDDLRELVTMALAEIEALRYSSRPHRTEQPAGGLFADFDLGSLKDLVKERYSGDIELNSLIGEKEKDLKQRVDRVQKVLARYLSLATLGQLIDVVLHDGRTPVAKIRNESKLGLRILNEVDRAALDALQRLLQHFEMIDSQAGLLGALFNRIEPFSGRKRSQPKKVFLEEQIANAFSVLDGELQRKGVKVHLPESRTLVKVDSSEIQEVIINLLNNSLYWLGSIPQELREITVNVSKVDFSEVEIIFSDSGPGVRKEYQDRIFDPYFSTKPDGVGLGLTISGEIINSYYEGSLELLSSGPLPGATFRIILRKGVLDV